ncbi:3-oxoacid CoA-transferase subunit B [Saccharomonospora sp. NPDC046836]|uniref:3-oxoacid CoA-transferase subunit B n=1 Tax=Saccharomonospora sp. NPDC046836 TaxID=3156921 RepID=UPI0033E3A5E2
MTLTDMQIVAKAVRDVPAGSYVNLGIGMPVTALDLWRDDDSVVIHSENGILGMRALDPEEPGDPDVVNAGKQPVAVREGAAYFHHADSFAMMRGGHLDYSILGAYQVSAAGDIANWSLGKAGMIPAVGGAMDLVVGAKNVWVVMRHLTRDGGPRLVESCTMPLTGAHVVRRVYTDLATIDVGGEGFVVTEISPDVTVAELRAATDAPLQFAPGVLAHQEQKDGAQA